MKKLVRDVVVYTDIQGVPPMIKVSLVVEDGIIKLRDVQNIPMWFSNLTPKMQNLYLKKVYRPDDFILYLDEVGGRFKVKKVSEGLRWGECCQIMLVVK